MRQDDAREAHSQEQEGLRLGHAHGHAPAHIPPQGIAGQPRRYPGHGVARRSRQRGFLPSSSLHRFEVRASHDLFTIVGEAPVVTNRPTDRSVFNHPLVSPLERDPQVLGFLNFSD